jgi:hypothetical protein
VLRTQLFFPDADRALIERFGIGVSTPPGTCPRLSAVSATSGCQGQRFFADGQTRDSSVSASERLVFKWDRQIVETLPGFDAIGSVETLQSALRARRIFRLPHNARRRNKLWLDYFSFSPD